MKSVLRISDHMMPVRKDWNRLGKNIIRIPPWFRRRLASIDKSYRLQYMPPCEPWEDEGVNYQQYPYGLWAICKLMKSGFLAKQWVWILDRPTHKTLRILRLQRDLSRRNKVQRMEYKLDEATRQLKSARCSTSRAVAAERIMAQCRAMDITKRGLGVAKFIGGWQK